MLQAEWEAGELRDCNGLSNGLPLAEDTLLLEVEAGPYWGTPAGQQASCYLPSPHQEPWGLLPGALPRRHSLQAVAWPAPG